MPRRDQGGRTRALNQPVKAQIINNARLGMYMTPRADTMKGSNPAGRFDT